MPDIFHTFIIKSSPDKVFEGITTSKGLDAWWTKTSEVEPALNGNYTFHFGPGYTWKACASKYIANKEFELQMQDSDADWYGTKVGFLLTDKGNDITEVYFYHTGWPQNNDHYRISSFCWAMYLRLLKRYIEFGEQVDYEKRLNV